MPRRSVASAGEFTIRAATNEDAPGILACLHSAFRPYQSRYTPAGFEDTVLNPISIRDRLKEMSVFVAIDHRGAIIGTIGCQRVNEMEGHIRGMAVLPEWQGRSVAEKLLHQAEAELSRENCSRITLDTTEPLERAMKFYERNGFQRSGQIGDFFGMPLIEYVKSLKP